MRSVLASHNDSPASSLLGNKQLTKGKGKRSEMAELIQRIVEPELFFGIVAPIGTDVDVTIDNLADSLKAFGYKVAVIKVTDLFKILHTELRSSDELHQAPLEKRYKSYIEFGDKLRQNFADDSFLAQVAIAQIGDIRDRVFTDQEEAPGKIAYIVRQFKRKEEIDLFRLVYNKLFFQISIYSQRSIRVDNLARKIANSHHLADPNRFRDDAESLVKIDEKETGNDHGQRVGDIFHEADLIVNADLPQLNPEQQVERFVNLLFGSNSISPTKIEYGMYIAKSASLRTIDLSRQVGAAVFNQSGEILSLGTNEVPKAGGGTYWSSEAYDDRDYKRGRDSNDKRKKDILSELMKAFDSSAEVEQILKIPGIKRSQFMDALEYGRIIHAEMSAICDAARIGRPLKESVLYCTTFPCHMCAKHIVASGIGEVVFLEPYPKSLASELHGDSIEIEGQPRGIYSSFPKTLFRHFYGVSPRRYRDLFEKHRRKDEEGKFQSWFDGMKKPYIDIRLQPPYIQFEPIIVIETLTVLLDKLSISIDFVKSQTLDMR